MSNPNQALPETLPPLRQELTLSPGAPNALGAPTWVLQDAINNKFYYLEWPAFEILARWHLQKPASIQEAVNQNSTLAIQANDIAAVLAFLNQHCLLQLSHSQHTSLLVKMATAKTHISVMWLVHHYLFFRIPLVRPTAFLNAGAKLFNAVFTPAFWWALAAIGLWALYGISQQWDVFIHTFATYTHWQGWVLLGVAVIFAKLIHELGHAFTAHHYGCRIPTMGIAFLVMMPLPYTDTNDSWKLANKNHRQRIAAAGIIAELVLAVVAAACWNLLPDGLLRAAAFMLASSTWVLTLLINASPFTRFDGYFILADGLNLPNLHDRAFALGKWWLREKLFGLQQPPPENFPPQRHYFLIVFAVLTALYRAILFFGIALLVYHVFFKALGIILMLIELLWFIFIPIFKEIHHWYQQRHIYQQGQNTRRTLIAISLLCAALVIPWRSQMAVPAVVEAQQAQGLYLPDAGRVVHSQLSQGAQVQAGDILAVIESPEITYKLQQAQAKEAHLRWQVEQQSLTQAAEISSRSLIKQLEGAQKAVQGLTERQQRLTITAPFSGTLTDVNPSLKPGTWLASGEKLAHLVNANGLKAQAYLDETQLLQLQANSQHSGSVFLLANNGVLPKLHCVLEEVDSLNLPQLDKPALASSYGGSIPTQQDKNGLLIPLHSLFRARLAQCQTHRWQLQQETPAMAYLQGESQSLLKRAFTSLAAVLQSERGF